MNSLRSLRKGKGLSQNQLAELLGVNQTAVSQWERGVTTPSSRMLLQLSRIFDCDPNSLLGFGDLLYNDPEIMKTVDDSLSTLLLNLEAEIRNATAEEQKMSFDVLVSLRQALRLSDQPGRDAAFDMLHDFLASFVRFMNAWPNNQGGA